MKSSASTPAGKMAYNFSGEVYLFSVKGISEKKRTTLPK